MIQDYDMAQLFDYLPDDYEVKQAFITLEKHNVEVCAKEALYVLADYIRDLRGDRSVES